MTTDAVRSALVGLLQSVVGIGRVHPYERFAAKTADFVALYIDGAAGSVVRGWHVTRVAVLRRRALASGRALVATRWMIQGYLSLVDADASEIGADALIDAIVAAERDDPTLGGVARGTPIDGAAGIRLEELRPVMFAGVLCHGVKLVVDVETVEPTSVAGGLADLVDASDGLVGAVVDRLRADVVGALLTIDGRPSWDPLDAPIGVFAATVVPLADLATPNPETTDGRQRVDRRVGVIVSAPASFAADEGALAAGGLEALRRGVIEALIGWGEDVAGLDTPLFYAGGAPIEAAPGHVAWRETFQPSTFLSV